MGYVNNRIDILCLCSWQTYCRFKSPRLIFFRLLFSNLKIYSVQLLEYGILIQYSQSSMYRLSEALLDCVRYNLFPTPRTVPLVRVVVLEPTSLIERGSPHLLLTVLL